jgi:peptidoglycan/xylan/chitin deacetylase (PgdA/CDA1 family)
VVSTTTFEQQVKLLRLLFRIVPLAEAAESNDPDLCAITFDDGWEDNHAHALPILRRVELPATLFVTTGFIGTSRLFWPERLAYLLADPARANLRPGAFDGLDPLVEEGLTRAAGASDEALPAALDALIERAKVLSEEDREQMLDLVGQQVGRDPSLLPPRLLTWGQVGEMHTAGIEIGAHGVTHAILTRIEPTRALAEIRDSRVQIEQALGRPAESFAYPNGDATPELARAVAAAGYRRAVVTESDPLPGCPPKFALRRKNLAEGSSRGIAGFAASVFACEVLGLFDAIRALGRRGRR